MTRYNAGQPAPYGLYVSTRPIDICFVGADDELLEGRAGAQYVRLPTLVAIAASPVIGGAFVLTFPFVVLAAAIGGLGVLLVRKVRGWAGHVAPATQALADRYGHLSQPRWEPSVAYLDRPKDPAEAEAQPAPSSDGAELKTLEDEVKARREQESNQ